MEYNFPSSNPASPPLHALVSVALTHRWPWLMEAFWLRPEKQALTLGWQEEQPYLGAGFPEPGRMQEEVTW